MTSPDHESGLFFWCRPFSQRGAFNAVNSVLALGGIGNHGAASLFRDHHCGFTVLQLTQNPRAQALSGFVTFLRCFPASSRVTYELMASHTKLRTANGQLRAKFHSE